LEKGLWDELRIETNLGLTVSGGTRAPQVPQNANVLTTETYGQNVITWFSKQD
jgi:diaminohydroxyphosphoribosylaminopyrimidine deaminase/5-amino-6-(5-phosphoribosylamino)uracil reductase